MTQTTNQTTDHRESRSSPGYQHAVETLIAPHLYLNVTLMVTVLIDHAERYPRYADALYDAAQGNPDYETAARDSSDNNGWNLPEDADSYSPEEWEMLCREYEVDVAAYALDTLEYHVVSSWLAARLEGQGEKVIPELFGHFVWCRCTTGQSIMMDAVIEDIYDNETATTDQ